MSIVWLLGFVAKQKYHSKIVTQFVNNLKVLECPYIIFGELPSFP